jgi:hypothetical protein
MSGKIDRNLLFIFPKQTFLDWANKIHPTVPSHIRNQPAHEFGRAFLVHEFDSCDEVLDWMSKNWQTWLKIMLMDWSEGEELWPKNLSWELFTEFFEVVWQPYVMDMLSVPVRREEV